MYRDLPILSLVLNYDEWGLAVKVVTKTNLKYVLRDLLNVMMMI